MRGAPSIDVINLLLQGGATVKAYDPAALETARGIFGDTVDLCTSSHQVAEDADALVLITEWDEFRNMDLNQLKGLMSKPILPILVDGRNFFDPQHMTDLGWLYHSIGR
jgi:UDPglucose 6-dehydrogenase